MRTSIKMFVLSACSILMAASFALGQNTDDPGAIRGQVLITRDDHEELLGRQRIAGRYLSRSARSPESTASMKPERYTIPEKTVIYLEPDESIRERVASISSARVILDQRDLMFYPHVLPLQQGTTVVFPNNDDVYHNVFSYSKPRQFDLGRYPQGHFRTIRFDTPGIVRIYCDIHAHMNAVILVLDNPYFTSPDESGNYSIPEVPAGNYTVHFWYGRNLVESREIEVKPGSILTLNFVY